MANGLRGQSCASNFYFLVLSMAAEVISELMDLVALDIDDVVENVFE